jgi:hydroxymethylpyrimidine/phosphomethylpyrimidine kinase
MNTRRNIPAALTVAGSDSGGGAGVQADLRTFNAFNVYGCSVITAATSQNPDEVRRVDVLPVEAVKCQMETVLDAFPVRFAKTGMLADHRIIECVAAAAKERDIELVVDPVMVSTSGAKLLEDTAINAMRKSLFPLAKWITPNIPEAELICGKKLANFAELAEAALAIYQTYQCNIILKSGHCIVSDKVTDIVCYRGELFSLSSPLAKISNNTAHGTGCTLSAALAANLASGKNWQNALITAKAFVYGSLCENVNLSDTLSQMYPPEKNYLDQVILNSL